MAKSYSLVFIALFLLTPGSYQSLEQTSIDYLQPADLSFPPQLRKVAIVNNTSDAPDNKLITETEKIKEGTPLISRVTAYANGDPKTATESLAEEIAQQNYFDEAVIYDSALRANDKPAREGILSREKVRQLAFNLEVDLIIALENLQLKATKTIRYLDKFNCFQGAVGVKAYPTMKVYLPERSRPMTTLHPNDSIFWGEFGDAAIEAAIRMIPDKQVLEEAAASVGTAPVKNIVLIWKKGTRHLYTGGSVPIRDTVTYVHEDSWDDAYELWRQAFEGTKNQKKKIRAALNITVYYEMKDSLAKAEEQAEKAQQPVRKIDKKNIIDSPQATIDDVSNYYLIILYLAELRERNVQLPKLKLQMSRFNDDSQGNYVSNLTFFIPLNL